MTRTITIEGNPVRLFWQLAPASGMRSFPTIDAAAAWADEFLSENPDATILVQE